MDNVIKKRSLIVIICYGYFFHSKNSLHISLEYHNLRIIARTQCVQHSGIMVINTPLKVIYQGAKD